MMQWWFLLLIIIEVILVSSATLLTFVNGLDCSLYKRASTVLYGFSYKCSSFSFAGDDKLKNVMPSGEQVYFNITTMVHECTSYACLETYHQACSRRCPCCNAYAGADPGFHAAIWAPNNESDLYMQNLNCTIPPYIPVNTGFYFFWCNFTGYGMANTSKLVQIQLTWNTMNIIYPPYTSDVYIIAGNMSLPDCIWQWERGNKFPLNEYGVFRILLYDGYGNKISAATGGTNRNIVEIDVSFRKYGAMGINDSGGGGLRLDVHTTWKLTYQIQYGFCIITIYCASVGKYQMKIIDEHSRALLNTPTTFYVLPDEAWTGTRYRPPPAPRTYFLGDNSEDWIGNGNIIDLNGVVLTHVTMNLLLTILFIAFVFFCLS